MNKKNVFLILVLLAIMVSCVSNPVKEDHSVNKPKTESKSMEKSNPYCMESNKLIIKSAIQSDQKQKQIKDVFQVDICPMQYKSYYDDSFDACGIDYISGVLVVDFKNNFYDNEKLTLPDDLCLVKVGVTRDSYTRKPIFMLLPNEMNPEQIKQLEIGLEKMMEY